VASTADILVVGLGALGSAAVYQAAKLGARAIGIDRFHPPHEFGSSHGETRITRQAIGEGAEYVPLVLRSNQIWEELEAETGRTLLTRSGVLILASPYTTGDHHGSRSFLADTAAIAGQNNIAHEILTTDEIRRRFPQFCLAQEEVGYFEPGAGFLRPEACIETQLTLARQLGAEVRTGETVLNIRATNESVQVVSDRERYEAGKVIVCAGPWIGRLLPAHIARHLQVYRQVMCWFGLARNTAGYTPDKLPVFIWITGDRPNDMLYGFPQIDGCKGMKVATESYEHATDPDRVERAVDPKEIQHLYAHYIATRLPDVSSGCLRAATCLYTVAPGARFVIDQADDRGRLCFASACSGHGFKHSAAVGEALARQALGLPPLVDTTPFRADRMEQL
jgi:sarcosine oxidase